MILRIMAAIIAVVVGFGAWMHFSTGDNLNALGALVIGLIFLRYSLTGHTFKITDSLDDPVWPKNK